MGADPDRAPIELARAPSFAIGRIEVRPATREVLSGEDRTVLQPRIMQVLVALARKSGEVVSRDDLISTCWGGLSVGDDAINRCIAKLRNLGQAHGAFAIETIARVGYLLRELEHATPQPSHAAVIDTSPVLVVLPFDNLSDASDLQYFSDGVSGEILDAVSRVSGLRVIGPTSSFAYRGMRKADAAQELGASHVLDGSVRRSGARVRISAHLTEAATGHVVWGERFDRELVDVFALQDEIAAITASGLSARIIAPRQKPQLDAQAYDLYLRAIALNRTPDQWAWEKAIAYLEAALAIEPAFARARATLALTLCNRILNATTFGGCLETFDAAIARVRAEAERALADDQTEVVAQYVLFTLEPCPCTGGWMAQEKILEFALEAAPNDWLLRSAQARFALGVGRFREGLDLLSQAFRDDPHSPRLMALEGACRYFARNDVAGARALLDRALEMSVRDEFVWRTRIAFVMSTGDWDGAADMMACANENHFSHIPQRKALFFALLPRMRDNTADPSPIRDMAPAFVRGWPFVTFSLFLSMAQSGLPGEAVDLLDQAMAVHPPHQLWTQWSVETLGNSGTSIFFMPDTANVRAHERFLPLCARIGLCGYWAETGAWPDYIVDAPDRTRLEAEVRRLARDALKSAG